MSRVVSALRQLSSLLEESKIPLHKLKEKKTLWNFEETFYICKLRPGDEFGLRSFLIRLDKLDINSE